MEKPTNKKEKRKCFTCRGPVTGKKVFCNNCKDKEDRGRSTADTFVLAEKK